MATRLCYIVASMNPRSMFRWSIQCRPGLGATRRWRRVWRCAEASAVLLSVLGSQACLGVGRNSANSENGSATKPSPGGPDAGPSSSGAEPGNDDTPAPSEQAPADDASGNDGTADDTLEDDTAAGDELAVPDGEDGPDDDSPMDDVPADDAGGDGVTPAPVPDPEADGPHALGIITLAETHAATGGSATPSLTAVFVPDATGSASRCARALGNCELTLLPACGDCGPDQACVFDERCEPQCVDLCTMSCGVDEECYFAESGSPTCRTRETFDAGGLTFSGTTTPLTVFPPYQFSGMQSGSLFASGATLGVTAEGATAAGFGPFEESFRATSLMQSSPSLSSLTREVVFGTGDLSFGWASRDDEVSVLLSLVTRDAAVATLTCRGTDAEGSLTVPRSALTEAVDGAELSSVFVALTRTRQEVRRGLSTTGRLRTQMVQPEGWLQLTTSSTETHSFQGCGSGLTACGDTCVDLAQSDEHCGSCGNACDPASNGCNAGSCGNCGPGLIGCGGSCVDLDTNLLHCGRCDRACASGATCQQGECVSQPACGAGLEPCGSSCVDTSTNTSHCGGCNTPCSGTCSGGVCTVEVCPSGLTTCGGSCVDISSDVGHCGGCNLPCDGSCTSGVCTACAVGLTQCGSSCVDLNSDSDNCGFCGYPCGIGTCQNGACVSESEWICPAAFYGDGYCDCGCGELDSDCPSASNTVCDLCVCETTANRSCDPVENWKCE